MLIIIIIIIITVTDGGSQQGATLYDVPASAPVGRYAETLPVF